MMNWKKLKLATLSAFLFGFIAAGTFSSCGNPAQENSESTEQSAETPEAGAEEASASEHPDSAEHPKADSAKKEEHPE